MTFQVGHKKLGGRAPGVPNRATAAHKAAVLRSGLSPIDYLCSVYRDPNEPTNLRISAAQTVASFVYPKLSSVDVSAHSDQPMVVQVIKFADMPLEDQRAPTIDVIPDTAVTDAIAVAQDDDEAAA